MGCTGYRLKIVARICMIIAALIVATCGVVHLIEWEQEQRWAWYDAGFDDGVTHAIEDSEIYTVDYYDPENPEGSEWNGYDQQIFIELDGQTYEHGMYQG